MFGALYKYFVLFCLNVCFFKIWILETTCAFISMELWVLLCYVRECKSMCECVHIFSYAHMHRTVSGCQGNVLIKQPNRNRVMDRLEWERRERKREKGAKHF